MYKAKRAWPQVKEAPHNPVVDQIQAELDLSGSTWVTIELEDMSPLEADQQVKEIESYGFRGQLVIRIGKLSIYHIYRRQPS